MVVDESLNVLSEPVFVEGEPNIVLDPNALVVCTLSVELNWFGPSVESVVGETGNWEVTSPNELPSVEVSVDKVLN